ncbi:MAG: carboxymuconolactone decarboxylase family protein [Pseudomonadales bacterium]|nr:carboxymuconolactone decarboxylase family protein [Pseudomonadales bacterium]
MQPQPLLTPLPRDALSAAMQQSFDRAVAERGDATFVAVAGHAPELFDWYADFYQKVFYGGRLPVRYKEIARLRLSTAHGCAFCNKGNRLDAERAGLTLAHIEAIERPLDPIWTAAERALLQLAGQMLLTNPTGFLSPELYADLRPHFDDAQLFELGMTLAVLAGMAKFLFVYDLVEKEPYCQIGKPVG